METKSDVINGMFYKTKRCYTNCHLSYRGRSVIIDYEHYLHNYDSIPENTVPIEMYPYSNDIYVDFVSLDPKWNKVNLEELITKLNNALDNE